MELVKKMYSKILLAIGAFTIANKSQAQFVRISKTNYDMLKYTFTEGKICACKVEVGTDDDVAIAGRYDYEVYTAVKIKH